MNVDKLVGNTPMIKIDYEYEGKKGSIYSKVEYYNYSGSIKDRIALYIIQKEKERGNLKDGQPIIEVTSGNTGIAFSAQYMKTGQEIIDALPDVNAFVSGIGTGGTLMGIGKRLKDHNPDAKVFALEPSTLSILKMGMDEGSHLIEGIGDDFIPGIVDEELIDDIVLIHDCDAINMSKRIAQELGLGIGISSGANFLASVIMDNDDLKIATVFPDDNKKYITTKLSEPIDEDSKLISNHIKLIGFEVI